MLGRFAGCANSGERSRRWAEVLRPSTEEKKAGAGGTSSRAPGRRTLCGFRSRSYGVLDVLEFRLPHRTQLVMHLEFQPEFWRGAEVSCKS